MMINILQPGMILILTGLLLLVVPKAFKKCVMLMGPALTVAAVMVNENPDKLDMIFAVIFAGISLVLAIYNLHADDRRECAVEAIYAGSSLSVVFADDWLSMIVFWELMAVASWLIVLAGKTERAAKAGFRYLLVHMFGGNMLLAGIVMKMASGSTQIECLTGNQDLAFWFILIGVAVNAAIPPVNAWISDSYPESTVGGTVYMGSYTTKVGVFCLIKLFAGSELLLYFGIFMAVYGAAMALIENDLRRLFSYHIVSQVGYMVAALAFGSEAGIDGAAAHAFNNILYKGTLLMCAGAVIMYTGKRKISELGGLAKKMPLTAVCFLLASMAIAGFPLLNGFVSKSLVMNAAAESGQHWAELLLMLASIGSLMSVTLKVNYFVFFGKSDKDVAVDQTAVPLNMKVAMVMGAGCCIVTGLFPNIVYGLTPYGIDGHPFTVDHVTQYMQLFAAAAIAFVMYIEHMKPKEKMTLDTDWFYRVALKKAVEVVSVGCNGLFEKSGQIAAAAVKKGNEYLHDPEKMMKDLFNVSKRQEKECLENDDVLKKPAGDLVLTNFLLFGVILVVLFIFVI